MFSLRGKEVDSAALATLDSFGSAQQMALQAEILLVKEGELKQALSIAPGKGVAGRPQARVGF